MTDTVTNTTESVDIVEWLLSALIRQHNDEVFFREDLSQQLGIEFLPPDAPVLPERFHSKLTNEAIRAVMPLISDGIKKSGVIATKVAAAMVEQAKQTTARTAVRRVERDEHGRVSRIVDEVVPA